MEQALELYSCPQLSIASCVTVKLTERNYILWKLQFESYLIGQGMFAFVDGSQKEPQQTIPIQDDKGKISQILNPDYQAWKKSDQIVKSWILGSLLEDILSLVIGCNSAYDVWYVLSTHFNQISASRLFELQRKLQTLSKESKTMSEYLREVKNICDQLNAIGNPVDEKMKIFAALHGLGREYESIVTVIENAMDIYPGPRFDDVVSKLTGFDDKIRGYDAAVTTVNSHLAFQVTTNASIIEI